MLFATVSREDRNVALAAVLWPWLMVALIAVGMLIRGWQDRQSDRYIENPAFEAIAGCPATAAGRRWIAAWCVDPRYRIRQTPERYGLSRHPGKHQRGWLRVGPDALRLRDCSDDGCAVAETRRGVFRTAAGG